MRTAMKSFGLMRFGLLIAALALCQSCGEKPSEGYLATHYEELLTKTVPLDAANLSQTAVKHMKYEDSAAWEFETKQTASEYKEWLREKLKGDFKVAQSRNDALIFSKDLNGDAEAVTVSFNATAAGLHVRVEASITPD